MSSSRYSRAVDLNDLKDVRALATLLVRPKSRVLDVGAADGSVAQALRKRGCRVWAIEVDPEAGQAAQRWCEQVFIGDVEGLDLEPVADQGPFDVLLILDVLEHLKDPVATLRKLVKLVGTEGGVILSVPNVTHAAVRLQLLQGQFARTETGLLDRTHLQFFDRAALNELLRQAHLVPVENLRVVKGITETEIKIDPAAFHPEVLRIAKADPDSDTYQFLIRAVPGQPNPAVVPETSLAETLQQRLNAIEDSYRELEEWSKELEATQLAKEHLQRDVVVKDAYIAELRATLTQPRYVLANRLNRALRRVRPLHWVLKRLIARRGDHAG